MEEESLKENEFDIIEIDTPSCRSQSTHDSSESDSLNHDINHHSSNMAVDLTWGEWMQQLPGSTTKKIREFLLVQWRWSKNLATYAQLPEWLKDNKFILSRHRLPIYSFTGCMFSVCRCHSETGNIWTHLLGSLASVCLAIYCYATRLHKLHWSEQLVYGVFFATAALCMGFSCIFHTLINHSPKMFKFFSRLDYTGIALLVVGSNAPWLYYTHFCRPLAFICYITGISIAGTLGVIVALWEEFDKPKYRTFRAAVFLTMGLTAVVPGLHFTIKWGWSAALEEASVQWMILMGFFYISGTCIYMAQVPERWFPGKFDIWFQSHQIMHVFVFIAVLLCYHGISRLEHRHALLLHNGTLCTHNLLNFTEPLVL